MASHHGVPRLNLGSERVREQTHTIHVFGLFAYMDGGFVWFSCRLKCYILLSCPQLTHGCFFFKCHAVVGVFVWFFVKGFLLNLNGLGYLFLGFLLNIFFCFLLRDFC